VQGSQVVILTQNDKVNEFMKKLELWKRNIKHDIFDMFPMFEKCCPSNETEAK
jgi:hypothetical protein